MHIEKLNLKKKKNPQKPVIALRGEGVRSERNGLVRNLYFFYFYLSLPLIGFSKVHLSCKTWKQP